MKTSHLTRPTERVIPGSLRPPLSPRSHCKLNREGRHFSALPPTLTQSPIKADCWSATFPSLGPWPRHTLFPFHTHIRSAHPLRATASSSFTIAYSHKLATSPGAGYLPSLQGPPPSLAISNPQGPGCKPSSAPEWNIQLE